MITLAIFSFLISLAATGLVLWSARWHGRHSGDDDEHKPQRMHVGSVPRVGGVGIVAGLAVACVLLYPSDTASATLLLVLAACSAPVVLAGFVEDVTKRVSPGKRLLAAFAAALLAAWALDAIVPRIGIPGVDSLFVHVAIALPFTVFAVGGAAHALNIVDGFNGLAGGVSVLMLSAVAVVAYQLNDRAIFDAAILLAAAVLGFLCFNFPFGKIFLGDGGAYFIGFMIAELLVLLVVRHPAVSPFFALAVLVYPVFETVVSILRRQMGRGVPAGHPDSHHLHHLIYKRLVKWGPPGRAGRALRNGLTAPYLWALTGMSLVPAVLFWDNTLVLAGSVVVFCVTYSWLYRRLLTFRRPEWLVLRGGQVADSTTSAARNVETDATHPS
jgi:UDP-N-acetylmuramyl pentapeptide phosphotransferase/UDP-N-acetylglucosamine-1-phosphate transferase